MNKEEVRAYKKRLHAYPGNQNPIDILETTSDRLQEVVRAGREFIRSVERKTYRMSSRFMRLTI